MREREIPEGVSDTVVCPVCGKPMTWKISNITDKYAWHCRNIHCSEYNPEQVDKELADEEPAGEFKPAPALIDKNCIQVNVLGGVVQEITGIPKGEKVIVIDWDTEGVDKNRLTQLEEGEAIISTWRGESEHEDQAIDLEKLKEYMNHRDILDCYTLTSGTIIHQTIIKPDPDMKTIMVRTIQTRIGAGSTEQEYESLDDMAENNRLIHLAFRCGAFYVHGYELGGC